MLCSSRAAEHSPQSEELRLLRGEHPKTDEDDQSESTDSSQSEKRKLLMGYGSTAVGYLCVSFGQAFCQLLDRSIPHSELNGVRYSFQFVVSVLLLLTSKKVNLQVEKKDIGWVILTSIAMLTGSYSSYGITYYLPIGMASGISRSTRMLLMYLIGCIVDRSVRVLYLASVTICLAGVVMVVQPPFIFHHTEPPIHNFTAPHSPCNPMRSDFNSSAVDHLEQAERDTVIGYIFIALEIFAGIVCVLVLKYKLTDLDTKAFMFWQSLFGVVVSFCLMGATENPVFPHLPICVIFLMAHMVLSGSHNFFLVYGFKSIPPTVAGLMTTIQIPTNFVLQFTVLSGMYPGHGNAVEIAGALSVFAGNVLVPSYESIQYFTSK